MDTEAERERYESADVNGSRNLNTFGRALFSFRVPPTAEQAFLQAIREQHDWPSLRSKAEDLAARAASWDEAEHAAWRGATDELSRNALAASTDSTELISAIWRDVALAFAGRPSAPY